MYKILLIFLALSPISNAQLWQLKGNPIYGTSSDSNTGADSRISGDANTIVVGSFSDDIAKIYKWDGTDWILNGQFSGPSSSDEAWALDINFDGTIIASGAYQFDAQTIDGAGRVRVFQLNGGQLTQMGSSLYGENQYDFSGYSISLSDDGQTLAVCETGYFTPGIGETGRVRIYKWNGNDWEEMPGSPIPGIQHTEHFGDDLSLNEDGTSLVIGDVGYHVPGSSTAGLVQAYEFNGLTWVQKGSDILFPTLNHFGHSVSNSADGNTIVVGAISVPHGTGTGEVITYNWNGTSWDQIGQPIYNDTINEFGFSLELNHAGDVMIVAARETFTRGSVSTYHWTGSEWLLHGQILKGDTFDYLGRAVDISAEGTTFIAGSIGNDVMAIDGGAAFVYEVDNLSVETVAAQEDKKIVQITDVTGRITEFKPNTVLIFHFSDGSYERIFSLE